MIPTPSPTGATEEVLRDLVAQASVIPHTPWPKQREFLKLRCREAMMGGAAGGGKSDALLMAALLYWDRQNYGALLMRRTYAQLSKRGALMDRAAEWLRPTGARWNEAKHTWRFPSGSVLAFGHMETSATREDYQSSEWDFIGVDELTDWFESDYLFVGHRIRRVVTSDIPPRLRSSTTPGGIGHEWVKKRFIDEPGDRIFVRSKATDNPSLDLASYLPFLDQLPPIERAQKRDGQWIRDDGTLVYKYDDTRNGVDALPDRPGWRWFLAFDVGASEKVETTAYCVGCYSTKAKDTYLCESRAVAGATQDSLQQMIDDLGDRVRSGAFGGSADLGFESMDLDPGGHGRMLIKGLRERGIPVHGAETRGKVAFQALMNGDFEAGRLKVVRRGCRDLIEDWGKIAWAENRKTDDGRHPDHRADAALYAWRRSYAFSARGPAPDPEAGLSTLERSLAREEKRAEEELAREDARRALPWDERIV